MFLLLNVMKQLYQYILLFCVYFIFQKLKLKFFRYHYTIKHLFEKLITSFTLQIKFSKLAFLVFHCTFKTKHLSKYKCQDIRNVVKKNDQRVSINILKMNTKNKDKRKKWFKKWIGLGWERIRDNFRSGINIMKHIIELSERSWNHE